MVGLALKQHGNAYAAPGCRVQGTAETHAGHEIGVGDQDFALRLVDGVEVGIQDVVAVADVVADQEGRALLAGDGAAGRADRAKPEASLEVGPGDDFPHAADSVVDLPERRPLDAYRVVVMRAQFRRRIVVADDIDAADKGNFRVDDHQLAMQAAQAMALEMETADFRPVVHGAHPGGTEQGQEVGCKVARAEAIDRDIDLHAAFGRTAQGASHLVADLVVGEDVAFEVDLGLRFGNGREQGGEVVGARVEQGQPVARQEFSGHAASDGPTARHGRKSTTTAGRGAPRCA